MDIAGLSMQMSYVNTMRELQTGTIGMALDQMELMGEQIAMMIRATEVLPNTAAIDGTGGLVDLIA